MGGSFGFRVRRSRQKYLLYWAQRWLPGNLRYLETQEDKKAGGCVFVAGWFKLKGELYQEGKRVMQLSKPWTESEIDFGKVLQVTKRFKVLISDDEPYNAIEENKKMFEEKLGANVTILESKGHFTEADGVTELPEALEALQEFYDSSS